MSLSDNIDHVHRIIGGVVASVGAPVVNVFTDVVDFHFDRLIIALVLFAIFFSLRRPIAHFLFFCAGRIFRFENSEFRQKLGGALKGPVELLPVAVGTFLAFQAIQPDTSGATARFGDRTVGTLFIVVGYWALVALIEPIIEHLRPRASTLTDSVVDWARKALKCVVVFFAIAAVLEEWGIRVGPLLAGMGIAGAAIALGAQALFKNLISGVLILLEERFQYGDWVKVEGVIEGTVESIGFRSTRIRQFDDSAVQVPNSDLADNAVINYSQMRRRRIYWVIGVPYSSTIDQLKQMRDGIETYIHTSEDFVSYKMASTFVRIDSFGASAINIMVYCFTNTTHWGEWLLVKERLGYKIMEIVEGAGSSFAFPSTSLYVETLPNDKPDLFLPPEGNRPRVEPAATAAEVQSPLQGAPPHPAAAKAAAPSGR